MKTIICTAAAAVLLSATAASAQTTSHNPAYKDSAPAQTAMPAEGSNSFTEDQARGRFAKAGYTAVTGLKKSDKGLLTATATKGGKSSTVALDYKGNISVR